MIGFYLDDDSGELPVLRGLAARGWLALRSIEAGTSGWSDDAHMAYAAKERLVLVSANQRDFVKLHVDYMRRGLSHSGIVIAGQRMGIGTRIARLDLLASTLGAGGMANRIEFLSHWSG